ncbi:MAG: DciA family protein, partial [Verrucomicrobiales bacterium]
HSRPLKVQRRVLFVQVLQPTLHYEFERTLKKQLLEKIKQRFGSSRITDIRFTLG